MTLGQKAVCGSRSEAGALVISAAKRAVIARIWGRKRGTQRQLSPEPFACLEAAWPTTQLVARTRVRHSYRVVQIGTKPVANRCN